MPASRTRRRADVKVAGRRLERLLDLRPDAGPDSAAVGTGRVASAAHRWATRARSPHAAVAPSPRRSGACGRSRRQRGRPAAGSSAARAAGRCDRRGARRWSSRQGAPPGPQGCCARAPPSMKCSPAIFTGGNKPGTAVEASTASVVSDSRRSPPVPTRGQRPLPHRARIGPPGRSRLLAGLRRRRRLPRRRPHPL